ncbi:MAG: condensation domain-containing protein, partial [Acidobacteriota bacterium]
MDTLIRKLGQGKLGRDKKKKPLVAVPRVARTGRVSDGFSLSFAQERLWFLDQLDPGSPLYNIPAAVHLLGELDAAALRASFAEVVQRHEALRTTFRSVAGRPLQLIAPLSPLALPVIDLGALSSPGRAAAVARQSAEEAGRGFDLAAGPLLRCSLLRLAPCEHVLLLTLHHIVSDGWSIGVMLRELQALYGACLAAEASPLAELPLQYVDYAQWQRDRLAGGRGGGEAPEGQLAYWQQRLADLPRLELPTDRPRPATPSHRGATLPVALPTALSRELAAFSRRHDATLFMTLLASFATLLGRTTGQTDVPVGSPIANRNHLFTEDLIGFFVNTVVLRIDLAGDSASRGPTFRDLVGRVRELTLAADASQDVPFERVVQELDPERDLSTTPMFQVMFVLQNAPLGPMQLPGLELELMPVDSGTAKFDLTLALEGESSLEGTLEYRRDLFDATSMRRLLRRFEVLLGGIVAQPERRLGELPLLSAPERAQLLWEWNDTARGFARHQTLPAL